jgi:hypothetical protein
LTPVEQVCVPVITVDSATWVIGLRLPCTNTIFVMIWTRILGTLGDWFVVSHVDDHFRFSSWSSMIAIKLTTAATSTSGIEVFIRPLPARVCLKVDRQSIPRLGRLRRDPLRLGGFEQ